MQSNAVTLGDLIERDGCLEFGCFACRIHLYVDPRAILLPPETAIPDVSDSLRCLQCGVVNKEKGYPLWTRPDARPPRMGADARSM